MKGHLKTWIRCGQALFTEEIMKRDHRGTVTTITHAFQIDGDIPVYCKISVSQVEMATTWGRKVLLILCSLHDV